LENGERTALGASRLGLLRVGTIASAAQKGAIAVGTQKQLFIDDLLVESREGVVLTMNPPRKTNERCIVADKPWESACVCAYNTVMEDEGLYKMWYDAVASDASRWLCYATSRDGVHWEKPRLGLVEFEGSRENNIVFPLTREGAMTYEPGCVFIEARPGVPRQERYKMVCTYGLPGGQGTYVFASADGLRWSPLSDRPSFRSSDTGNVAFWDERIGRYVAFVRVWAPLRMVGRCEFDDLRDWGQEQIVFRYDESDPPHMDFYTNAAVKYPFADSVYLIFPSAYFHYPEPPEGKFSNDGLLDIRLAVSRDGIHFTRPHRRPFVGLGVSGSWDDSALYMATGMIRSGAEVWMYYAGFNYTHGVWPPPGGYQGTISRLVLRLDGFVSADADYGGGVLTTKPLVFEGRQLRLNLETSVAGTVLVEILGEEGTAVPGFSAGEADPIKGNYIERVVTWRGREDVGALAGQSIRLRFRMRDAKLYAFQFGGT